MTPIIRINMGKNIGKKELNRLVGAVNPFDFPFPRLLINM